jgi:hypothetical protein
MTTKQQASDLPDKLGQPAQRALAAAGIQTLKQLAKYSEAEVGQLHGVGPNALARLREALNARGLSFSSGKTAVRKKAVKPAHNPQQVNEFMDRLEHPFKAEVQALREIILGVNKSITEQIKWSAPSFSYKGYMATFNLWEKKRVHLIFHNGAILRAPGDFLQGDYPDRRMVYFTDMEDVKRKRPLLEKAIRQWIKTMDKVS